MSAASADAAWARVVERFDTAADVTTGRMFQSEGLRLGAKYFAMLCRGELVVKLPADRIDELEAGGVGERFEPGPGRVMREWLSVPVAKARRWPALTDEAHAYAQVIAGGGAASSSA
jgi:hypothetical protein